MGTFAVESPDSGGSAGDYSLIIVGVRKLKHGSLGK